MVRAAELSNHPQVETKNLERSPNVTPLPTRFAVVPIKWGEKRGHLYVTNENAESMKLFDTEEAAHAHAKKLCSRSQDTEVAVLQILRLVKAKPIELEVTAT